MQKTNLLPLSRAQNYFINALLSIMKEKPYQNITVQELSETAQYDRRTYYRYFNSKEDILRLYCSHILGEMALMMKRESPLTFQSGIIAYFNFWEKYIPFLRLLQQNNLLHFLEDEQDELLYYHVGTFVQTEIPQQLESAPPISKYAFYFTSGGLWNTLVHWIKEEPRRSPKEMTEYILTTFTEIGKIVSEQVSAEFNDTLHDSES